MHMCAQAMLWNDSTLIKIHGATLGKFKFKFVFLIFLVVSNLLWSFSSHPSISVYKCYFVSKIVVVNVCFIKIRSKLSSVLLLCLLRIFYETDVIKNFLRSLEQFIQTIFETEWVFLPSSWRFLRSNIL